MMEASATNTVPAAAGAGPTAGAADAAKLAPEPELLRVKIAKLYAGAEDIRCLELVDEQGAALPPFKAGAHVDVEVFLENRQRARRSYSIASPPSEQPFSYLLAVQYEMDGTGGSIYLHERLRPGYIIEITPPKNFFELAPDAEHSVLIAGGVGITPLMAMAHELTAANKPFELHYAARRKERMAFTKEVAAFGDKTHLYITGGDPKKRMDLAAIMGQPSAGRHIYVCGPVSLIEDVRRLGHELGFNEKNIHSEIFKKPDPRPGDGPIEVVVKSTGKVVQVPAKTSILDALLAAGVTQDYDCRVGTCGTCAVNVVEGTPDHRDNVLLDAEKAANRMCTCVSRALTPQLVLDL